MIGIMHHSDINASINDSRFGYFLNAGFVLEARLSKQFMLVKVAGQTFAGDNM